MEYKSGFISIIGRPNAGKSTLLNAIMQDKLAIVTDTAQTTRNNIQGIITREDTQYIFIDTPGIHKPQHQLGTSLNKSAYSAIAEADLFYYVVDASVPFGGGDAYMLERIREANKTCFLILNKVDKVAKEDMPGIIMEWNDRFEFAEIFPLSAQKRIDYEDLLTTTRTYLPEGPQYYPEDMHGDKDELFYIQEIIREKVILKTKEEVPHSIAVKVEKCEDTDTLVDIAAVVIVERDSQKGILIGKQGDMIRSIRLAAQKELKVRYQKKVNLELFVRVEKSWRSKLSKIEQFGYGVGNE